MVVSQLAQWGNSQGIRIPKEILKDLNVNIDDQLDIKFEIKVENGRIILDPRREKTMLEVLFEDFDGDASDYKTSVDWGEPRGKEIW